MCWFMALLARLRRMPLFAALLGLALVGSHLLMLVHPAHAARSHLSEQPAAHTTVGAGVGTATGMPCAPDSGHGHAAAGHDAHQDPAAAEPPAKPGCPMMKGASCFALCATLQAHPPRLGPDWRVGAAPLPTGPAEPPARTIPPPQKPPRLSA